MDVAVRVAVVFGDARITREQLQQLFDFQGARDTTSDPTNRAAA
jgi:hypothetical protein